MRQRFLFAAFGAPAAALALFVGTPFAALHGSVFGGRHVTDPMTLTTLSVTNFTNYTYEYVQVHYATPAAVCTPAIWSSFYGCQEAVAATTNSYWQFTIPFNYAGVGSGHPSADSIYETVRTLGAAAGGAGVDVRREVSLTCLADSEADPAGGETVVFGTPVTVNYPAAHAAGDLREEPTSQHLNASLEAGDMCTLVVRRLGADAADDYTGITYVAAPRIMVPVLR